MKEPVDHIIRPRLPWRCEDADITECGYNALSVKSLTREEYFQRVKELGQQRSAMLTCMTCMQTAQRWGTWNDDPRRSIAREVEWEYGGGYRARTDRGQRLKDELLAIFSLIESHSDEFADLVATIVKRREWIEKKSVLDHRRQAGKTQDGSL